MEETPAVGVGLQPVEALRKQHPVGGEMFQILFDPAGDRLVRGRILAEISLTCCAVVFIRQANPAVLALLFLSAAAGMALGAPKSFVIRKIIWRAAGAGLLSGLEMPLLHSLTTYHHTAPSPPADEPLLHLDGTGGPIANTVVMPDAYAPAGRALISSTVVGAAIPEPDVRRELARVYGAPTDDWELLRTDEVGGALPAFPAGRPLASAVDLGNGLFVAGDHRDTPSQQGALGSGGGDAPSAGYSDGGRHGFSIPYCVRKRSGRL